MASFTELANGNWQGDVQLMPEVYEALKRSAARDRAAYVDIINVAIATYDTISATMSAAGRNVGDATR